MCRDGLGCYGEGVVYLGIFVWFTLLTGSWCAIHGLQFVVCNSWFAVRGLQFVAGSSGCAVGVCGSWCAARAVYFVVCSSWFVVRGVRFGVCGLGCVVRGVQFVVCSSGCVWMLSLLYALQLLPVLWEAKLLQMLYSHITRVSCSGIEECSSIPTPV